MRKSWMIVAIALLSLGSALAQRVEFPLDIYSYPEIAKRLSVEGRTVTCDPTLSQKLAVIGLKPREWSEIKALLEDALEVRIAPTDKEQKRWRISRTPAVLQRERELRQRWAKVVEQRIRDYRENLCAAMQKIIDPAIPMDEAIQSLYTFDLEEPITLNSVPSYFSRLGGGIARTLRSLKIDDFLPYTHLIFKFSNDHWRFGRMIDSEKCGDFVGEFLSRHSLERYYKDTPIESWLQRMESLPPSELSEWLHISEGDLQALSPERLRYHMLRQLSTAFSWYYDGCMEGEVINRCIPDVLQAIEQGYAVRTTQLKLPVHLAQSLLPGYESWHGLAPNAQVEIYAISWLQVEADIYTIPIHLSPDLRFDCAHPLVYERRYGDVWNLQRGYTVWELRLQRMGDAELLAQYRRALERHKTLLQDKRFHQSFKQNDVDAETLPIWFLHWAREHEQEVIAEIFTLEESVLYSSSTIAALLEAYLENRIYLLDHHKDVWILRNWFAFVDRAADYPLAALRDLARSGVTPDNWHRFWNTTTPRQRQWLAASRWEGAVLEQFHSFSEEEPLFRGDLYEMMVFTLTLESLSEIDRQALLNAAPNTHVRVSLRYLPNHTRQILLEWLSHELRYHPELLFVQYAKNSPLGELFIDRMELRRSPAADLINKAFSTSPEFAEELRSRSHIDPPWWCLVYVDPCGETFYLADMVSRRTTTKPETED
jgi:hypothetical protein